MELILHERTRQAIDALLENPQHAVIITGRPGSGKASIARKIAAELLGIPLDKLDSYQYAKILGDSDESITIESIREVQHFMSRKTAGHAGIARVALIIDAGRMAMEAQNALLKTLEEPPEDAVIIMTAKDEQSLLTTVRSRSLTLPVTTPGKDALHEYFAEQGYEQTDINRALLMSGSLPGLMSALLTQDTNHPLVKAAETARNILRLDTFARLALIDTLAKQKELTGNVLFILQQMAELSLADSTKNVPAQKQWRTVLSQAYAAEQTLVTTNATPKLVLTNLMLTL